jgi:hypothetical protein
MKLPDGLTSQEIRVLQEFRRLRRQEMTADEISAIRHPVGGGIAPAASLVEKGMLTADEGRSRFRLTDKSGEFLKWDPKP